MTRTSSNHRRTDLGLGFGQRRAGSHGGGADGSRGHWGSLPEDCAAEEAREAAARGGRGAGGVGRGVEAGRSARRGKQFRPCACACARGVRAAVRSPSPRLDPCVGLSAPLSPSSLKTVATVHPTSG